MRKFLLLFLVLILINSVSSLCSENQININTASITELDKLTGIGEAKAQSIINTRPFESIEGLINVIGIGEITLEKIKTQGLACVENEKIIEDEEEKVTEEKEPVEEEPVEKEVVTKPIVIEQEKPIVVQTISLSPQNIKSEKDKESLSSPRKYAIYGLIIFCVLLFGLFRLKKIRIKEEKNEFN